jgi:hypothetical protein
MAKSVYLDCKNNYAFAKITNRVPLIISEAGREIEGFVIFVIRANLNPVFPGAAIVGGDESRGEISPSPITHRGEGPTGRATAVFPGDRGL